MSEGSGRVTWKCVEIPRLRKSAIGSGWRGWGARGERVSIRRDTSASAAMAGTNETGERLELDALMPV